MRYILIFVAIIGLGFLLAVKFAPQIVSANAKHPQATQPGLLAAQAKNEPPTATATATTPPTATPTQNYPATVGALQVELQITVNAMTVESANNGATATANANATKEIAKSVVATQDAKNAAQLKSISDAAFFDKIEREEKEADALAAAKLETEKTKRIMNTVIGGVLAFVILSGFFFWMRKVLAETSMIAEQRAALSGLSNPAPADFLKAAPVSVRLDRRDTYGYGAVDFSDLPINDETMRKVCEQMEAGAHYTEAQMTGAANHLTKQNGSGKGSFDHFGDWMVRNGIATELRNGQYAITQPGFFGEWLKYN